MSAPAVRLKNVSFRYQEKGRRSILDHVSLDIAADQITVLMGSGGCGKSTLAAVAAGLYPENGGYLEAGSVELFGMPLEGMNQQQRAGYLTLMFQNPDLQFCMDTLRKELRFCLENLNVPREDIDRRAQGAARTLGMEDKLDRKLYTLSGGEKQKAMLCCLCAMESRCILLDEALANLDREAAQGLVKHLWSLCRQGITVIAIDHRLDYWLDVADEIVVLGGGAKVLARGISRKNLWEHQSLFAQEGLYFPEQFRYEETVGPEPDAAITLRSVSIPRAVKTGPWGRKQLEGWLLTDADAAFPKGRLTAVIGPSGCGKTTTFLSILKQHPYEGTILVHNRDLRRMRQRELFAQVGMVFQNPGNQFITQNVEEEVLAGLRIWEKDLGEEQYQAKAEELLEAYGLKRYRRFSPYMLSQGQQRRLAVLSVLAGRQKLLFLDEPTYGQDRRSTETIMEQLRHKAKEEGLTVVFITHDLELAAAWADKVYRVQKQKLVETKRFELSDAGRRAEI